MVCPSRKIQALPLDFPCVHMFLSQPVALPPLQRVFFSLGPQNLQTNLALVQSILEVGCAIQAVGNLGSFHPVLKHKLLLILQVSAQSQGCLAGEFGAVPGGRKVSLSRVGAPELLEPCPQLVGGALGCWQAVAMAGQPLGSCSILQRPCGSCGSAAASVWQQCPSPGRVRELSCAQCPLGKFLGGTCRT